MLTYFFLSIGYFFLIDIKDKSEGRAENEPRSATMEETPRFPFAVKSRFLNHSVAQYTTAFKVKPSKNTSWKRKL